MRRRSLTLGVLIVAGAALCLPGCRPDRQSGTYSPLPIVREWRGEAAMGMRAEAPASGYVATPEAWASLWRAWRGDEPAPEIDFRYELVLVVAGDDPNRVTLTPSVNTRGDVRMGCKSTALGYSQPASFRYHLASVTRGGLSSVGGNQIARE